MKKMIITETDFVKILMGNLYAYSPKFNPHDPDVIIAKARLAFRCICDEAPKKKGYYHVTVPVSDVQDMLKDILIEIPEFRDNMSDYSDMCIETIAADFREMALYDIMWCDYFDEMKSIKVD